MPSEPVKIPQNVYIEDRIVGPLTLKQTIIMAVTGGISYAIYTTAIKVPGWNNVPVTILSWVPFVIGTAFALVKINDLSLARLLFLVIEKTQNPSTRSFAPRRGITVTIRTADAKSVEDLNKQILEEQMAAKQAQKKITELSAFVDQAFVPATTETVPETIDMSPPPTETNETSASALPVDPSRVKTDKTDTDLNLPELTDLSAFKDVFPPEHPHG